MSDKYKKRVIDELSEVRQAVIEGKVDAIFVVSFSDKTDGGFFCHVNDTKELSILFGKIEQARFEILTENVGSKHEH